MRLTGGEGDDLYALGGDGNGNVIDAGDRQQG